MTKEAEEHGIDIDDLQAAIDASAHATVEQKERDKQPATQETVESKTEPENSTAKANATPSASTVQVTPAAPVEPVASPEPSQAEQAKSDSSVGVAVAVKTSSSPTQTVVSQAPSTEAAKVPVATHRGKTIQPIRQPEPVAKPQKEVVEPQQSATSSSPAEPEQPAQQAALETSQPQGGQAEPAANTTSSAPRADEQPKATMSHKRVVAPTESAPKPESSKPNIASQDKSAGDDDVRIKIEGLQATATKKAVGKPEDNLEHEETDPTKIYDTKEYHLPIKPNRHHKKPGVPTWVSVLVLIVLIAGGVAYAYLGTGLLNS